MNTSEIFNPSQRKQRVVENFLNSHFGLKLQAHGDAVQVQSLIGKLVTENQRLASSVLNYQNNNSYVKNTMIIEALKHILQEIAPARTTRRVNEQSGEDLAQAEPILVAKNMVEKLQDMAEDVAKMQTDELMPLEEKMKQTFGQEMGAAFGESADQSLSALLDAVKAAKDALSKSVGVLSGEVPSAPMGGEMAEPTLEPAPVDGGEGFGDEEFGGEELPAAGRELK